MYLVELVTRDPATGARVRTPIATNVGGVDALTIARDAAGHGASFMSWGPYQFSFAGPNGCVVATR